MIDIVILLQAPARNIVVSIASNIDEFEILLHA